MFRASLMLAAVRMPAPLCVLMHPASDRTGEVGSASDMTRAAAVEKAFMEYP